MNIIMDDDFMENNSARFPVVICVGISNTLSEREVGDLNTAFMELYSQLRSKYFSFSVDFAVVEAKENAEAADFSGVGFGDVHKIEHTINPTYLASGMNKSLELIENKLKEYKNNWIQYYRPFLVLLIDGTSDVDEAAIRDVNERIGDLVESGRLFFIQCNVYNDNECVSKAPTCFSKYANNIKIISNQLSQFFSALCYFIYEEFYGGHPINETISDRWLRCFPSTRFR